MLNLSILSYCLNMRQSKKCTMRKQERSGCSTNNSKFVTFESLDEPLVSEIISLIGPNQYRFVAMINRKFLRLYTQLFPQNTNTYINTSTLNHAKIVFEELEFIKYYDKFYPSDQLCRFAIENGNLPLLKYLHSQKCHCSNEGPSFARNGHLHILKWLKKRIFLGIWMVFYWYYPEFFRLRSCCRRESFWNPQMGQI